MTTLTAIQQVRLMVGDTAGDFPFLDDNTYSWLIELNPTNSLAVAVEALEMIINQLALSPQSLRTEDITEIAPLISSLENRLQSLKHKAQRTNKRFPMLVHTDRTDWEDINSIYRNTF